MASVSHASRSSRLHSLLRDLGFPVHPYNQFTDTASTDIADSNVRSSEAFGNEYELGPIPRRQRLAEERHPESRDFHVSSVQCCTYGSPALVTCTNGR